MSKKFINVLKACAFIYALSLIVWTSMNMERSFLENLILSMGFVGMGFVLDCILDCLRAKKRDA